MNTSIVHRFDIVYLLLIPMIAFCISLSHNWYQQLSNPQINLETSLEIVVVRFTLLSLVIGKLKLIEVLLKKSFPDILSFWCHIRSIPFVQHREYPEAIVKVQKDPSQLTAEEVLVERIAYLIWYWWTFHFYYKSR